VDSIFGLIISVLIGIGLAAACGFKVSVPMLVMSIAVKARLLDRTEGWNWVGSWPAMSAFFVATVVEIGAYYLPWIDNFLDSIQSPAAVVAGTAATAACVSDTHPLLQWSTAIITGVTVSGSIQLTTVATRATSSVTTGGLGNWVVATIETVMSFVMAVLAVFAPILAGLIVCAIGFFVIRSYLRRRQKSRLRPNRENDAIPRLGI
jgi:hypothetical protein